jgi:hypothetical protein
MPTAVYFSIFQAICSGKKIDLRVKKCFEIYKTPNARPLNTSLKPLYSIKKC